MNDALPLDDLLASWVVALKAERKRPATLRTYEAGVRLFLRFLAAEGLPPELTKANVIAFLASQADNIHRHRADSAGRDQTLRPLAGRRGRLRRRTRAVGQTTAT